MTPEHFQILKDFLALVEITTGVPEWLQLFAAVVTTAGTLMVVYRIICFAGKVTNKLGNGLAYLTSKTLGVMKYCLIGIASRFRTPPAQPIPLDENFAILLEEFKDPNAKYDEKNHLLSTGQLFVSIFPNTESIVVKLTDDYIISADLTNEEKKILYKVALQKASDVLNSDREKRRSVIKQIKSKEESNRMNATEEWTVINSLQTITPTSPLRKL